MKKLTSPFKQIQTSFEVFSNKDNILSFIKVYLPAGVLSLVSLLFVYIPSLDSFFNSSQGNITMLVFNLIYTLVVVFVNLAGIVTVSRIYNGVKVSLKDVYSESFSKYGLFLLLVLVLYLIYGIGLILLVVPFILLSTWFAFSKFLYIEKRFGIGRALSESKRIVKGNFWRVFLRVLVFTLFSFISQIVLTALPYGIGVVVYNLCGALFVLPLFMFYKEISA